jgi:hypothetical protein
MCTIRNAASTLLEEHLWSSWSNYAILAATAGHTHGIALPFTRLSLLQQSWNPNSTTYRSNYGFGSVATFGLDVFALGYSYRNS